MQVLLAAVLVDTLHAALEHGEVAFDRVRVDDAPDALALSVSGRLVVDEGRRSLEVHAGLVGVERGFLGDGGFKDRDDGGRLDVVHDHGADLFRLAIDQGQHFHLVMVGALLGHAGLAANEGLIDLYDAGHAVAVRTHRGEFAGAHGLAQAVHHEPRRPVGDFKRAVKLVGAETLLAGGKQVRGLKPLVQRDFAVLENRSDLDRKLLPALGAGTKARASRLPPDGIDTLRIGVAAMRAHRTLGPDNRL